MTSEDVICSAGSFFGAHWESFHRPLTSNGKGLKMGDYKLQNPNWKYRLEILSIEKWFDSKTRVILSLFSPNRKPKEKKIKEIRTEINYRMQKFVVKEKSLNPSNLISLTSISFPLLPFVNSREINSLLRIGFWEVAPSNCWMSSKLWPLGGLFCLLRRLHRFWILMSSVFLFRIDCYSYMCLWTLKQIIRDLECGCEFK
jgi:hypothetical protein